MVKEMLNNIYSPLSGSLAQEKVLDIIANNLANMNTNGFKEEKVAFKLLSPEPMKHYKDPLPPANYKVPFEELLPLKGNDMAYVGVSGVYRNLEQGPIIETKNPLDLMIEGDGYMSVMTRDGIRYTRDGALSISPNGAIVTHGGDPILGKKGDIFVKGHQIEINKIGEVYQDGQLVDQIVLYDFSDINQLERVGNNQYFYNGEESEKREIPFGQIKQGFLEGSNVNPITNLTQMIIAHRSAEAYQKAIKNFDSMMEKSSNTIGEVRA